MSILLVMSEYLKLYMTQDRMLGVLLIVLYFLREGKGMFAILKLKMTILERGVQFLCPWL
jgi:hypothetical protein